MNAVQTIRKGQTMKTLLIAAALAVLACSPKSQPAGHAFAATASGVEYSYWQTGLPVVTGNTATITLFDTTMGGTQLGLYKFLNRVTLACNFDQTVTVNYDTQLRSDLSPAATWYRAAGTNASYAFTGGTTTTGTTLVDYLVQGQEARLQAVTGGTGPSVSDCALRLVFVRDLGQ